MRSARFWTWATAHLETNSSRQPASCRRRSVHPSLSGAREEPARAQHKNCQKRQVPSQDLPFRIDLGADGLGDADDDAAEQRAPQAAEPADDDGLEGIEQACGPDGGVEGGALAEIKRGAGTAR